jgi:hypothetical protein
MEATVVALTLVFKLRASRDCDRATRLWSRRRIYFNFPSIMLASFSSLFNRPLCGLAAHPAKWFKSPFPSSVLLQTRSRLHSASHPRALHPMASRSPNAGILPRVFRAAGVTCLGLGLASASLTTAHCDGKYPARLIPCTNDTFLQSPHLCLRIAVLRISRCKEFHRLLPPQYRTTSLHLARWLGYVLVFSLRKAQKQWPGFWVVYLYCFRSVLPLLLVSTLK